MKWLNRLSATLLGLIGIGIVRDFFNKYDVLVFDKEDVEAARQEQEEPSQEQSMDLRGPASHECICGSNQFYIRAIFDNYEIAQYFLDMQCVNCGSLLTAPTPVDRTAE